MGDFSPVIEGLRSAGVVSLAFLYVMLPLRARRVGLLTPFMSILGIIVGVLIVLRHARHRADHPGVLAGRAGLLLLGKWPGGRGPAWESGEAEPWPYARPSAAGSRRCRARSRSSTRTPRPSPSRSPSDPRHGSGAGSGARRRDGGLEPHPYRRPGGAARDLGAAGRDRRGGRRVGRRRGGGPARRALAQGMPEVVIYLEDPEVNAAGDEPAAGRACGRVPRQRRRGGLPRRRALAVQRHGRRPVRPARARVHRAGRDRADRPLPAEGHRPAARGREGPRPRRSPRRSRGRRPRGRRSRRSTSPPRTAWRPRRGSVARCRASMPPSTSIGTSGPSSSRSRATFAVELSM